MYFFLWDTILVAKQWNKQFETNVPGATSEEEFWQPRLRTAAVVETAEMTSNENCFIKNILDWKDE